MPGVYRFLLCVSATAGVLALGPTILMVLIWAAPARGYFDPSIEPMIRIATVTLALIPLLMAISIPIAAIRHRGRGTQRQPNSN